MDEELENAKIVITSLNGLPRWWDSFIQGMCHMPQFAKQFNVIEEHYVKFYAKFVNDKKMGSRIINVF